MRAGLDAPWKAATEIRRRLEAPAIRLGFGVRGVAWGRRWRVYGWPVIQRHRGSRIVIGDGLDLRSWYTSNPLGAQRCVLATWLADAELRLGTDVKATGVILCAQERVVIGDRVRLGAGVMVIDSDFHPVDAATRAADPRAGASAPVTIGDDVFIGTRATVLKGSELGAGCVVGAGSVVSGRFPPGALITGNPARVVRAVIEGEA